MKDIKLLIESLHAYNIAGSRPMYKVLDLHQALLMAQDKGYIDKHGIMLTPFYILEGGHLELMPYDFVVDLAENASSREPRKASKEPGYWEKVREITHKQIEHNSPIVRKADLMEWVDLILSSKEIHGTVESVFHEEFKSDNAYFEAYLDCG